MIKFYFQSNSSHIAQNRNLHNALNTILAIISNNSFSKNFNSNFDYERGVSNLTANSIITHAVEILPNTSVFSSYLQHAMILHDAYSSYAFIAFSDSRPQNANTTANLLQWPCYIFVDLNTLHTVNINTYYNGRRRTTAPARDMTAEAAVIIRMLIENIKSTPSAFNSVSFSCDSHTPSMMKGSINVDLNSNIGRVSKLLLGQDLEGHNLVITTMIPQSLWHQNQHWQDIGLDEWFTDIYYDIDLV